VRSKRRRRLRHRRKLREQTRRALQRIASGCYPVSDLHFVLHPPPLYYLEHAIGQLEDVVFYVNHRT